MSYKSLYKDPRWQKRRLEILNRDQWTCQKCFDSKSTLNVHHLWYEKGNLPWEYVDQCLITLCEDCHLDETEYLEGSWQTLREVISCKRLLSGQAAFSEDIFSIAEVIDRFPRVLDALLAFSYGGEDGLRRILEIISKEGWEGGGKKVMEQIESGSSITGQDRSGSKVANSSDAQEGT